MKVTFLRWEGKTGSLLGFLYIVWLLTSGFCLWGWEYEQGREGRNLVFLLLKIITRDKTTEMGSRLFTTLTGAFSIAWFSVILLSTSVQVSFTCLICLLPMWKIIP